METPPDFIDFYEVLEISPNANSGTIERMFRYFAQLYHPDNRDSGDRDRFDIVLEAHRTLADPVKRAEYDVRYKSQFESRWKLAREAGDRNGIERDFELQMRLLSLLYVRLRQNIRDPGIGNVELETLLGCPAEHLEFHVWYFREKGWAQRTEKGTLAITVDGVDRIKSEYGGGAPGKFLTDQTKANT